MSEREPQEQERAWLLKQAMRDVLTEQALADPQMVRLAVKEALQDALSQHAKNDPAMVKTAVREALREWLDEKYLEWGKWSMRYLVAALLGLVVYLLLSYAGWRAPIGKP